MYLQVSSRGYVTELYTNFASARGLDPGKYGVFNPFVNKEYKKILFSMRLLSAGTKVCPNHD